MKKLSILILTLLLAFSCSKEKTVQDYEVKEFVPSDNSHANRIVHEFLSNFPKDEAAYKNSIELVNKDPNEGAWIMEGAQNFERRNKMLHRSEEVVITNIVIENVIEDGVPKMKMSDMLTKYLNLNSEIQTKEGQLNKDAKIVDFQITNVSRAQTEIEVKIVYGQQSIGAANTWPTTDLHIYDATVILNDEINAFLASNIVNPSPPTPPSLGPGWLWVNYWNWYAGVNISVLDPNNQPYNSWNCDAFCYLCLYRETNNPYFPVSNYPIQYYLIPEAAQDIIDLNGGGTLASLVIEGYYPLNQNTGISHAYQVFTSITTANTYIYEPPIGSN